MMSKTNREIGFIMLGTVTLIILFWYSGAFDGIILFKEGVEEKNTWEHWGISIKYPADVEPQYSGVYESEANEESGLVNWVWNNGDTLLGVFWMDARSYDYEAGFEGVQKKLEIGFNEIKEIKWGQIVIDNQEWQYRTYSLMSERGEHFSTYAYCFYKDIERAYGLSFSDITSDTLHSLEQFASTFEG